MVQWKNKTTPGSMPDHILGIFGLKKTEYGHVFFKTIFDPKLCIFRKYSDHKNATVVLIYSFSHPFRLCPRKYPPGNDHISPTGTSWVSW